MKNVLVVEDSRIARDIVEGNIKKSKDYYLAAAIENAANAEIVCMNGEIDLVLMDVCTADDESGLEAAAKIKKHYPEIRIIIITSMPEYSFIKKARMSGCDGFWYKEYGDNTLMEVMDRVMAGEVVYPEKTPVIGVKNILSDQLTERELSVMRLLTHGCRYEEIAEELGVTVNTVKYHVKNLLAKTGYKNTLQMVADVVEKKLILPKY